MITIADVARHAGVSTTTVSHATSGKRPVSEATAECVRRSIEELGYVPNRAARSLKLGIAGSIGLLVPDISNPYFAELARGVEDTAAGSDVGVILCNTDFCCKRELRYFETLLAGGADGIVYAAGQPPESEQLRRLAQAIPLVAVDEPLAGIETAEVVSDNFGGGRQAGEHLLALGHRRILVIDGPPRLASAGARRRGLFEALAGTGAEVRVRVGDYLLPSGEAAVRPELSAAQPPWFTSIFAANDLMALGAMIELEGHGIRVPDDVSVVGFDDSPLASIIRPSLTTVRQRVGELGRTAASRLIDAVADPTTLSHERLTLSTELVRRETTQEVGR